MEFEEVMISDPDAGYEIEYITEDTDGDATNAKSDTGSPTNNVINTEKPPVLKKKTPIIRKAGEIVTPLHVRTSGNVEVSPLPSKILTRRVLTARSKAEWKKVEPASSKVPLTPVPSVVTDDRATVMSPESEDMGQACEDHEYAEAAAVINVKESHTQMDRIEKKLDMILVKLNHHDAAFKDIKYSLKDLRVELKNSVNGLKEEVGGTFEPNNGPSTKRKRLVCFPVADDSYLLRLEDLFQADDQIRDEVTMLFKEAPRSSVYEFLRKNIKALFENCSKYTWTGKPSNAMPTMPPANVAGKMALVDHLITCAWETFPYLTREFIAKDLRRALSNFNDAVYTKRKKRTEMKLQNVEPLNDFDGNAEPDLL